MARAIGLVAPTLLISVGELGDEVLRGLLALAGPSGSPSLLMLRVGTSDDMAGVCARAAAAVDELLQLGASGRRDRMDLVLVGDLEESEVAPQVVAVSAALSQLFAERYPQVFPPSVAAAERSVAMVPVLALPALADNAATKRSLDALSQLERSLPDAPSPLLSRIFLLPRQHEFGLVSEEDLRRTMVMFVSATYFGGARDQPEVADLLRPSRTDRLLTSFNLAAASVPVEEVVSYFGWRSAELGLGILRSRCGRSNNVHGASAEAESALGFSTWLSDLEEDSPLGLELARTEAPVVTRASGGERTGISWTDSSEKIRNDLEAFLSSRAREHLYAEGEPLDLGVDEALLGKLDQAEFQALRHARAKLAGFLERTIVPEGGLRRFSEIEGILELVEKDLRDRATETEQAPLQEGGHARRPPSAASRDGRAAAEEVERLLDERPSLTSAMGLCGLLFAALLPASIALRAAAGTKLNWGGISNVSTVDWTTHAVGLGLLLVFGFALSMRTSTRALSVAVGRLRDSRMGRSGRPRLEGASPAGRALQLRLSRSAELMADFVAGERRRLQGLRAAIVEAQRMAEGELKALGAAVGETEDVETGGVLGKESALHRRLIAASALEPLWRRSRETADDEGWAEELLRAAWPTAGLAEDLPFDAEAAGWKEAAREGQHGSLLEHSVFEWPGVGGDLSRRLDEFFAEAPASLGLGVRPHDKHGDPLPGNRERRLLVLAPKEGRDAVGAALKKHHLVADMAYGAGGQSQVVVLRFHPGFSSHQMWHGVVRRSKQS